MKIRPAIALATLGVALSLAGGCTRTSDGSVVMRRPILGKLLGFRKDEQEPARIVPSRTAIPAPPAVAAAAPSATRRPTLAVPSIGLVKKAPFRTVDPDKPLACANVKNASGRVRVVCS